MTDRAACNASRIAAALLAVSRWTGRAEIEIAVRNAGTIQYHTATISDATTASGLVDALDPHDQPSEEPAGWLVLDDDNTADAPLNLTEAGTDAPTDGLARLAGRIHAALVEAPDALARDLAPDLPDIITGNPAHWADDSIAARTTLGACVDMNTGQTLSGNELERRVAAIAADLVRRGIGPGDLVGTMLPRGMGVVAAWMGILRAGAAFLHLDVDLPADRLARRVGNAAPRLILVDGDVDADFGNAPTVTLDALGRHDSAAAQPARQVTPADPAYVIYTSGSTGTANGVVISHGALAHHVGASIAEFGLTHADRVLGFAALGFDVAVEEIVPTFLCGATLVLRDPGMLDSMPTFLDAIEAERLTVLNLPTRFWIVLTEYLDGNGRQLPDCVRLVIVGGERVPASALVAWRRVAPAAVWMNGYGPTETTITATLHRDDGASGRAGSVPIGLPLGAARMTLLAPDGSAAPLHRPGELWIGGPGVASGYLKNPTLTARRFRPLPCRSDAAGPDGATEIWYRSGDLVQRDDHGRLVFMDRIDRQRKVRGVRIEPGGIEARLTGIPDVADAHVSIQGQALTVWVVAPLRAEATIHTEIDAAVPRQLGARVVFVPELPRNDRGKVDETALRALDHAPRETNGPVDPVMARIGSLMGEVLEIPALGPDDSFFDHGGTSLLALRLVEQLDAALGRRPSVPTLFYRSTPRALWAHFLSPVDEADEQVIPIQPAGQGTPLFGVHVLGTNASFYQALTRQLGSRHPSWGLTVGALDNDTPTEVQELSRFYLDQINLFHPNGPVALAGVSLGAYFALDLAIKLREAGREVALLVILDAEGPDLPAALGPRLRQHALRLMQAPVASICRAVTRTVEELQLRRTLLRQRLMRRAGRERDEPTLIDFVAANIDSVGRYEAPIYDGRVVVFGAQDGLGREAWAMRSGLGWGQRCPNLRTVSVPGDHLGILDLPGAAVIAEVIAEELAGRTDQGGNRRGFGPMPDARPSSAMLPAE